MQNASQVALLDPLDRERSDESSSDTRTVLGSQDLDGVGVVGVGLGGPVEDLAQGLGATGLEVRVLVEDRAVGTDVGGLVVLLLADGGNTACGQAGGPGADKLGRLADELQLGQVGLEVQLVEEQIERLLEVLKRIARGRCGLVLS